MKKIIILMPVFNDWESVNKLLKEINLVIQTIKDFKFECLIVNDCSTVKRTNFVKPDKFEKLEIINIKDNQGHARCNALGLRYINFKKSFDYVIVMDSDGEDRPVEIKDLIEKISKEPNISVVAKRVKRSEGIAFKTLYFIHKMITLIFAGKNINFGNYCCLTKSDINILIKNKSLWSSFSGSLKKHLSKLNEVNSTRGLRYFGPSKMSLLNLILHSFSIIAVFKYAVLLRSFLICILLWFLITPKINLIFVALTLIIIFNVLIFVVSTREKEKSLKNSNEKILYIDEILQH